MDDKDKFGYPELGVAYGILANHKVIFTGVCVGYDMGYTDAPVILKSDNGFIERVSNKNIRRITLPLT